MNRYFLILLLSTLSFGFAKAYTVDQLVANGGDAIETLSFNYLLQSKVGRSHGCRLVKVSDTKVRIDGLYLGKSNYTFELVNSSNPAYNNQSGARDVVSSDGNYLRIKYTTTAHDRWKLEAGYKYTLTGYRNLYAYNFITYDYTYLKIDENADGTFTLTSTTPILYANPNIPDVPMYDIFDKLEITTYIPNASATHSVNNYSYTQGTNAISNCKKSGSTQNETYNLRFDIDNADNSFSIVNLGNTGFAINQYNEPTVITGYINRDERRVEFDAGQNAWMMDSWGTTKKGDYTHPAYLDFYDNTPFRLTGFEFATNPAFPVQIFGTYTEDGARHNNAEHAWVTNGGTRRTLQGMTIEVDPYTFYSDRSPNLTYTWAGTSVDYCPGFLDVSYDNTVISIDNQDVTLDVDLKIDNLQWHPEDGLAFKAHLTTNKNDMYVDHYEVMVMKGCYSSIYDPGFTPDLETGAVGAIRVATGHDDTTFDSNYTPVKRNAPGTGDAENTHDYAMSKWLDKHALGDALSENGEYTFFVRAHYKDGTELTPTFHSLVYVEDPGPSTGIDDICAEIENTPAKYYNINGIQVDPANLAPGVYIKVADGKTSKLIVK